MPKIYIPMLSALLLFLYSGCATQRLPASDDKIFAKYSKEIQILHLPEDNNQEERYLAAERLFSGVDFSFLRDDRTLFTILGNVCKRNSSLGEGDMIQYEYAYKNKSIQAKFWLDGSVVLRSDIVFRDANAPKEKTKLQTLPRGTKVDVQKK